MDHEDLPDSIKSIDLGIPAPTPQYACDQCGACCKHLIIEIDHVDVVREPRLLHHATLMDGKGTVQFDSDWEKQYLLACGPNHPCGLLGSDNRCTIYPTRPNVCVACEPGDDQCQEAREAAKLPRLEPISALQPFCEDFRSAHKMTWEPFVWQFHKYATDGRICVRIPVNEGNWEPPADPKPYEIASNGVAIKPPRADKLNWKHERVPAGDWKPWPTLGLIDDLASCRLCVGGSKHIIHDENCCCDDCCDYVSMKPCPECHGSRLSIYPSIQMVCGLRIAVKYDALIRTLSDVQCVAGVSTPAGEDSGDAPYCVLFTFRYVGLDGKPVAGEGIVMSVAEPKS